MKLSIKNLSFAYTEEIVLKNINLTLDKKEFLVIVGKSGCGKTTLLRTIAGLESISQGSIEIDDVDVTFKDPKTRDISYVMQEYPLYPNLSVFNNISFGLKNKRLRLEQLETKVYEISKTLGVYKLLNEKPNPRLMVHTDQGTQYMSYEYNQLIKINHFISSYSNKGNSYDNAVIKSFFKIFNREVLPQKYFKIKVIAKLEILNYIEVFIKKDVIYK